VTLLWPFAIDLPLKPLFGFLGGKAGARADHFGIRLSEGKRIKIRRTFQVGERVVDKAFSTYQNVSMSKNKGKGANTEAGG
jgi:hypothetical protein